MWFRINFQIIWFWINLNMRNNIKKLRIFSKMIQNFKNLFHQELINVSNVNKIFLVCKKIKHVILMCILNTIIKQLETVQQSAARSDLLLFYADVIRENSAVTEKSVFKQMNHEITILHYKCLSLNNKQIKSVKIMKTINLKLEEKIKNKMIAVKKLFSENIVLITNMTDMKTQLLKKIS